MYHPCLNINLHTYRYSIVKESVEVKSLSINSPKVSVNKILNLFDFGFLNWVQTYQLAGGNDI